MEAIFYVHVLALALAVEALNVAEKWNRDTEREKVEKTFQRCYDRAWLAVSPSLMTHC